MELDHNSIYLMTDQPTTCPKCGARTYTLSNLLHTNARLLIEECLRPMCGYIFLVQDDDEYSQDYGDSEDPEVSP